MSLKLLNLASRLPVCLSELGYTNSKALPLDSAFIFTQVGAVLRQRRSDLFPGLKRGQVYYLNMWENYLNFKMYECVNSPITEFKQKNQIDITLPSGPLQMIPQVFAKAREDGGDGA